MSGLRSNMVLPPLNIIMLSSVDLGSLVIVPRLLLLLLLLGSLSLPTVTELAWRTLSIPLGTSVGKVSRFTTLEASIASSRRGVVVPRRGTGGSVLAVLLESGALSRLLILLVLLSWALVMILILPKADILSSWAVLVSLRGSKVRARATGLAL